MGEVPISRLPDTVTVRSLIGADSESEILASPETVRCVFNHGTFRQRGPATSKTAPQTQVLVQLSSAYRFKEGSIVSFGDGRTARVVRVERAERPGFRWRHAVVTCE